MTTTPSRTPLLSIGFDEKLSPAKTGLFGFQHLLALTGIWLFPGIIGVSLDLSAQEVGWITQGCFFMTGLITILQSSRILQLPIVQGPTAAFMVAIIASGATFGLGTAFGSMMVAGAIFALLSLPSRRFGLFGQVSRIASDPLVFGTLFVIIGGQLAAIGLSGWFGAEGATGYGWPFFLLSLATVVFVMAFTIFGGNTLLRRGAIFWGIVAGTALTAVCGLWALPDLSEVAVIGTPQFLPFGFGVEWSVVILMLLAFLQGGTESMGMFRLVSSWGNRTVPIERVNRGLFAEFTGSVAGAAFGGIGTTSYPENAGIVRMSGVGSRYVTATAGAVALVLAFIPKVGLFIAGLPMPVLAAASTVLFGVIAISGIQMLAEVEWDDLNLMVAAPAFIISLGSQFLPESIVAAMGPSVESIVTNPMMVGVILLLALHLLINYGIRPLITARKSRVARPLPAEDE
ncbi:purine/pyrimidine permease [Aeromicrobium sp. YIM 150415]|uniref:uracil-xanthine permease family protein n=1 Tax=Aeromicrobium sp. YIM 150415 TaxID=2803912 RepID=UPI0019658CDE|nr:solute carrier family 23 protein [Aeromicrobium sp. YIM 150415]MBM9463702.1 purine/pyrimidine permease [Aeromicrobium sp. YIM 150415]